MRLLVGIALIAACGSKSSDDGPCTCTPGNISRVRAMRDAEPLDGTTMIAQLARHRQLVRENRNPRDIKVFDDQLRFGVANFCEPCNDWVRDRTTIEELYPLDRLDDATRAVCMGLVLRDGSTVWGDARPRNCR